MMRKLRVRRGVLQTSVIRYRHRRTGRTVTLVGTAHVGEASYYKRLHAKVTRLEAAGAVVCYMSGSVRLRRKNGRRLVPVSVWTFRIKVSFRRVGSAGCG
jgi:hypothetical protein